MMNSKIYLMITALLLSLLSTSVYYRYQYQKIENARDIAVSERKMHQRAFQELSEQIKTLSRLDIEYMQERKNDKNLIAQLQRDVADGRRRLLVKTRNSKMSSSSSSSGVDDETSARLDDTAERNYFTLRGRIVLSEKKIEGLQDYIRQVCLKEVQQ